jgi:tetratricopeptide (TPR) repeat protein
MIRFLERSQKKIPREYGYDRTFNVAVDYLKELKTWHEKNTDTQISLQKKNELFKEWAPYLEPDQYYPEDAFVSCVRAKDLKRALFWIKHLDYMESPKEKDFLKGYAYEAVGDYETALKYYAEKSVTHSIGNDGLIRTYYYLCQYDKAADLLCDEITRYEEYDNRRGFESFEKLYLHNEYGIKQPLTTIDEVIVFLEKQKDHSQNKEKFDKAREILKSLKVFESDDPQ